MSIEQLRIQEEKTVKLPEDFRLIAANRDIAAKSGRAYLKDRGFTEKRYMPLQDRRQ